jgi:ribonuclease R
MDERYAQVVSFEQGNLLVDLFAADVKLPMATPGLPPGTVVRYVQREGLAAVTSRVAEADSALAAIWMALSDCDVDPSFPESVVTEVDAIIGDPGIDDPSLIDLTSLPFVTIDNVDSRDLDQAMHIAQTADQFILYYALADAAHFVRPGSVLFNEALRRGASYYVPGFAVPMLPTALSEGLVSLNESVVRRALVFRICFDKAGAVESTTVQQARIVSAAKLSYEGVQRYYDHPHQSGLAARSYTPTLDALRTLGRLRIEQARRRNVVEYDRSSVEISLHEAGSTFHIEDSERLPVEKYNEQISLVCNAEGARLLNEAGLSAVVQAVYRVHESPDRERLIKFSRLLKGLIRHYQLDPVLWMWRWKDGKYGQQENLSDYLERLRDHQADPALLAAVQRHSLMLSPASRFSAVPGGHHSLKLDHYARFSSPMREIAGVFTHREYLQLSGVASGEASADQQLREQVIDAANRAKETQKRLNRAVTKKAINQLFEHQLSLPDEQRALYTGTVMSLRPTRVYVQLDKPKITVKLYLKALARLTGQHYQLDRSAAFIEVEEGVAFALGQRLSLRTQSYSQKEQRWHLVPVS